MSNKENRSDSKQYSFATYLTVAVVAAITGFAAVYVSYSLYGNGVTGDAVKAPDAAAPAGRPNATGLAALAKGKMTTFVAKAEPQPTPGLSFKDGSGAARTLADWRGKVVLLNLWATWCAPCRKEMPDLDRLQGELGGEKFEVVPLSIDKGDPDKPKAFLEKIKAEHLKLYHDPSARAGVTLSAYGMPTTLLIDREGRELGRLAGPAEWHSPDAIALIKAAIAGQEK